jgi:hypothetical protein
VVDTTLLSTNANLDIFVEVIHDAGRQRRHQQRPFERKVEPEVKRDLLVGRVDEDPDDPQGQRVLGVKEVVDHGGDASAPLVNV